MGKIADRLSRPDRQLGYLGAGSRRCMGKRTLPLLRQARDIFERNNYDGFILLPKDVNTLFKTYTGTDAVAVVTDPVGLIEDQHLGLALGPELVTNGTFNTDTTGWTASNSTLAVDVGRLKVTSTLAAAYAYQAFSTVVGKSYKVSIDVIPGTSAAGCDVLIGTAPGGATIHNGADVTASPVTQTIVFVATAATTYLSARILADAAGQYGLFDNISVKLLDGNHLTQSSSPARPTWEVDANGKYLLRFLGTDDHYTCATGGGGSAGGYWCFALKPTGGAGTPRAIIGDRAASVSGYSVRISATDTFTLQAGNGAALTSIAPPTIINVGTTYRLAAWDDGTNLNTKINNGTVVSGARPVVAAGTAGFTVGKDNEGATSYLIADIYAGIYVRNACPSEADRRIFESLVDACAGL